MKFLLLLMLILNFLYEPVWASSAIGTITKIDWATISKNDINKNCKRRGNTECGNKCGIDSAVCTELKNFDENVCGCQYCKFNNVTRKCGGQCSNLILETCISKVSSPTSDNDCICASCNVTYISYFDDDSGDYIQNAPSCNAATTCYNQLCEVKYVLLSNGTRTGPICRCFNSA